jgi:hypothetical protein
MQKQQNEKRLSFHKCCKTRKDYSTVQYIVLLVQYEFRDGSVIVKFVAGTPMLFNFFGGANTNL